MVKYPSIKRPKRFEDVAHWWFWAHLEASLREGPYLPPDKPLRPVTELPAATMRKGYKMMTGRDPKPQEKDDVAMCRFKTGLDGSIIEGTFEELDPDTDKPQEKYTAAAGPATKAFLARCLGLIKPQEKERPASACWIGRVGNWGPADCDSDPNPPEKEGGDTDPPPGLGL